MEGLLLAHEGLLRHLVRPYRSRALSMDDLIQVATAAFLEAFSRYEPGSAARLGTFAYRRIQGALADAVRDEGRALRLPDQLDRELARMVAHEERLAQQLGHWPSWEEVADDLDVPHARMAELLPHVSWPLSLEELLEADRERGDAAELPEQQVHSDEPALAPTAELYLTDDLNASADVSGYDLDELDGLLELYAELRAAQDTGVDSLRGRGLTRRAGAATASRLADLDGALRRVPGDLFVALELHGLKGLTLRDQRDYTGVPHTTAYYRYKRGVAWLRAFLGADCAGAPVQREPFWFVDLDTGGGGFMALTAETELTMRRDGNYVLYGHRTYDPFNQPHDVLLRQVGQGWLLDPSVTGFPVSYRGMLIFPDSEDRDQPDHHSSSDEPLRSLPF